MALESDFDTEFVATLSYREKQMQQSYRPIIGIHKWFARRPGTLFRALLLSEFDDAPLRNGFYEGHDFSGKRIADPFMGGGTPLIEANRLGMGVIGADINPMAYWIVRQSIAPLDLFKFKLRAQKVAKAVERDLGHLFKTTCDHCGDVTDVKYFLRTKEDECSRCGATNALFPNYKIASNQRHPDYVWYCPDCEELAEIGAQPDSDTRVDCPNCGSRLPPDGNTSGKSFECRYCGETTRYRDRDRVMDERIVAIEYHCSECTNSHDGRFFKEPDREDTQRVANAATLLGESNLQFLPNEEIPDGDETTRLHNWGYSYYRDLFTDRQLLTLDRLAEEIAATNDTEVRRALATVFSDSLRYQNMMCRYDTWALKIQDVFSVHGFPAGLVRAENNVIGISGVGSGSFRHFVEKYERAKNYCRKPTEATFENGNKDGSVPIDGERIGATFVDSPATVSGNHAFLTSGDSRNLTVEENSLDGVFTDPPYFDNVQYSELMDFCYVWLKQLLPDVSEFDGNGGSTRKPEELMVNETEDRGIVHFTDGLSEVYRRMAHGLKPGSPLVFTYHHNDPDAYLPLIVGILDAGLNCTGTLAAPAEMSASLHISGTESSIVDTVFVCRGEDVELGDPFTELERSVTGLRAGGVDLTDGDIRCMTIGHMAQRAINRLYGKWDAFLQTDVKIANAQEVLNEILDEYPVDVVINNLKEQCTVSPQDGLTVQGGTD